MNAKRLNCTVAEYHKDPCERPSLSSSMAHRIVDESLLHAWTFHPKFGAAEDESSPDQEAGTILHKLLLGKGADIAVLDVDEFRSNADKALRDAALARKKIVVKRKHWTKYEDAANAIRDNLSHAGFEFTGESEVAVQWEEEMAPRPSWKEHPPVLCRAMFDHVFIKESVIFDVKKVRRATDEAIAKNFVQYGYDIQHEAYTRALQALTDCKQPEMIFLFCEIDPPYAVNPKRLTGAMREIGRIRWQEALQKWSRALHTKQWPSYSVGVTEVDPPAYVAAKYLGNSEG